MVLAVMAMLERNATARTTPAPHWAAALARDRDSLRRETLARATEDARRLANDRVIFRRDIDGWVAALEAEVDAALAALPTPGDLRLRAQHGDDVVSVTAVTRDRILSVTLRVSRAAPFVDAGVHVLRQGLRGRETRWIEFVVVDGALCAGRADQPLGPADVVREALEGFFQDLLITAEER